MEQRKKRGDIDSKIKVLMVISQFHPIIGGAEKQAQLLAETLTSKGIQVQVSRGGGK